MSRCGGGCVVVFIFGLLGNGNRRGGQRLGGVVSRILCNGLRFFCNGLGGGFRFFRNSLGGGLRIFQCGGGIFAHLGRILLGLRFSGVYFVLGLLGNRLGIFRGRLGISRHGIGYRAGFQTGFRDVVCGGRALQQHILLCLGFGGGLRIRKTFYFPFLKSHVHFHRVLDTANTVMNHVDVFIGLGHLFTVAGKQYVNKILHGFVVLFLLKQRFTLFQLFFRRSSRKQRRIITHE